MPPLYGCRVGKTLTNFNRPAASNPSPRGLQPGQAVGNNRAMTIVPSNPGNPGGFKQAGPKAERARPPAGAARAGRAEILSARESASDRKVEQSLRPLRLVEYIGQTRIKSMLEMSISAAKARAEALDHVLFYGPPGLGKTTLAQIVARELGVNFRSTSGPVLAKAGDLAAILTNLEPRDVLFIDEVHRLPATVEEILYPAMEDHVLDLVIGEGPSARSVQIPLNP